MNVLRPLALGFCALLLTSAACAAKGPAYATVEEARQDQDFAFQGEYIGEQVGVQVIALGDGRFRAVRYDGGLPGAGWDGATRESKEGTREELNSFLDGLSRTERVSPTLGHKPPENAVVLFDGTRETFERHWKNSRMTDDGLLMEGAVSQDAFKDFTLHLEFLLPYMPHDRGQARGNSGYYVQGRYEVQMLDSFGLEGKDNECGGIYQVAAPKVNMCFPPLAWQTYDVNFTAARFDAEGNKTANARVTVRHNGVVIHDDLELPRQTPGGVLNKEEDTPGPVSLQNHGDPVRYRNIWVVPG